MIHPSTYDQIKNTFPKEGLFTPDSSLPTPDSRLQTTIY